MSYEEALCNGSRMRLLYCMTDVPFHAQVPFHGEPLLLLVHPHSRKPTAAIVTAASVQA
jgi:hypothetical protein